MNTLSVNYFYITNNHKISVIFKNKHLFLIHTFVGWLGEVFLQPAVLSVDFAPMLFMLQGYVSLIIMTEVQKNQCKLGRHILNLFSLSTNIPLAKASHMAMSKIFLVGKWTLPIGLKGITEYFLNKI